MTTDDNGTDRTPAGRAVPALIGLGLVLVIAWLLVAIDRQSQLLPEPGAAAPPGPSTLSIPGIGVRAAIVAVGRKPNGAMETPDPDQVGWYRLGPRPGEPGPASATSTTRTARRSSTAFASSAPATRSWSGWPTAPPRGSGSAAWSSTARTPCPPTGSGRRPTGRCCA